MTLTIELIETLLNFDNSTSTISTFLFQFFGNALLLTIWNLIYFLYHFIVLNYEERIRILSLEASQHKAELNQLKNQLNPHFLFNSLNGIRALITLNPIDAKNAITNLSELLRSTLKSGKLDKINLSDEIKMVENYLDLEQMRFEDRLNVTWNIEIKNNAIQIPPFTLQLLVENAIKHGVSASTSRGEITIDIREQADNIQISVKNTGRYEPSRQKGIGIQNLTSRLSYFYGEKVRFSIENKNDNVLSQITIPI